MSEELLAVVREAQALVSDSSGRGEAAPRLVELADPAIHLDASRRIFNPAVYDGREGMDLLFRETAHSWEGFTAVADRFIQDGDRVMSLETIRGRGRASQVDVEMTGATIWTIRNGRITTVEIYVDQEQALRDFPAAGAG